MSEVVMEPTQELGEPEPVARRISFSGMPDDSPDVPRRASLPGGSRRPSFTGEQMAKIENTKAAITAQEEIEATKTTSLSAFLGFSSGTDKTALNSSGAQKLGQAGSFNGMPQSMKLVAIKFLDDKHYSALHSTLSKTWDRLHSLSAAIQLMESHGVELSKEEVDRLSKMDEDAQISELVMKMPQQSNEQFQHFFLQLQLLVSSAARIRNALEQGKPREAEECLDDAESTGIASYMLRMAIVQAGSEVKLQREAHHAYVKDADLRMARLIRGQEEYLVVQKKLAAVKEKLHHHRQSTNEKAKKFMMMFAGQSSAGLVTSCFKGWKEIREDIKKENAIRSEYHERSSEANGKLNYLLTSRKELAHGFMGRKALAWLRSSTAEAFMAWQELSKTEAIHKSTNKQVSHMEKKLETMKDRQSECTQKVVETMLLGVNSGLLNLCMQGWFSFHDDCKHEKELDKIAHVEKQQVAQHAQKKKARGFKICEAAALSLDAGLVFEVFTNWRKVWQEEREEVRLRALIAEGNKHIGAWADSRVFPGQSLLHATVSGYEQFLLIRMLCSWRMETKMEGVLRLHHAKMEAKRSQLLGVQQMFRTFATQLEAGLRGGDDSSRVDRKVDDRAEKRRLSKSDGTVSLPDIHRQSLKNTPKSQTGKLSTGNTPKQSRKDSTSQVGQPPYGDPTGQPRTAWS